jgi:hypothetical protein
VFELKADACWMVLPEEYNLWYLEFGVVLLDWDGVYNECLSNFNQSITAEYCQTNM